MLDGSDVGSPSFEEFPSTLHSKPVSVVKLQVQLVGMEVVGYLPHGDYAETFSSTLQRVEVKCCQPLVVIQVFQTIEFRGKCSLESFNFLNVLL